MIKRTISIKTLFLISIVLIILVYIKYESNHEKVNQQLLKEVTEKPIEQIQKQLNTEFVKKVTQ
jgi:sensor domain CHASE-containing protein